MIRAFCPLVALLLIMCSHTPSPVSLSSEWPDRVGDYEDVTRAWTREGIIRAPMSQQGDQLLQVHATLKSPEWRTAYVSHLAKRGKYPDNKRQELLAEQKKQHEEAYEVHLLVATYHPRDNDLRKGKRSIWRIVLVDDSGSEVEASQIKSDRRSPQEIRSEFPHMHDFHEAYIARFPRDIDLFGDDVKLVKFKMSSSRGVVELLWRRR